MQLLHGLGPTFPGRAEGGLRAALAVYRGINDFHSRSLTRPGGYQQLIQLVNFTYHTVSPTGVFVRGRDRTTK